MSETFDFRQIRKRVVRKVSDLVPYDRNPRINADALPYLEESIRRFGMNVPPVIDKNNVVVCGHTRLKACKELGIEEVECVLVDDLTPTEVNAFRLADNKIPEYSGWDFDLLDLELKDIGADAAADLDMEDLGFLAEQSETEVSEEESDGEEEEVPAEMEGEVPAENKIWVKPGDVITFGSHRLVCGDSTDPQMLAKATFGRQTELCITSPPYNIGVNLAMKGDRPETGRKYCGNSDQMDEKDYIAFLERSVDLLLKHSKEVFYNLGLLSSTKRPISALLAHEITHWKDNLYYQKLNPVPVAAKHVISAAVEPIFVFGESDSRSFRVDPGIWGGVITGSATGNAYGKIHRATFCKELPRTILEKFSEEGDTVLDPFLGTGTTLIAAEELGRKCCGIDLEPLYVQVAVERFLKEFGAEIEVKIQRNGREYTLNDGKVQ